MASQLQKVVLSPGNNSDYPTRGDEVVIEYTGWLYDASRPDEDFKGSQFDSSVGRGDFKTAIGVGRVIRGMDFNVTSTSIVVLNNGFPQVGTRA
ncbi:peptidylprolyl isomerase [Cladophialophora psammophila CBS 110553]|uniref:peptidylprolyl isomerase n=1 Tax=Cladophialophora psammophila CBS 110553 TaxID=1182543 RepID=W9WV91_9EURO|nr:peptidylprolyl isomerase [Cladophialophora psammophila CBS 110553]EXJ68965.1 peptidylprolyl isomerase [Cladophialophora psammophila CBS 110553]